jgi:predicted permease
VAIFRILLQPLALLLIIAAGYIFKRKHMVSAHGYRVLEQIIFNLTLPAAIIYSFAVRHPDRSMLLISLFGFICAVIPVPIIFLATRHSKRISKRFFLMLNGSGMNVGNFTFPVVQALWGPKGLMPSVMYDVGNCLVVAATSNAIASTLLKIQPDKPIAESIAVDEHGNQHVRVRPRDPDARKLARRAMTRAIILSYLKSPSFDVYIILIIMLLCNLQVPALVGTFLQPVSDANTFCSMIMIGMLMEMPTNKDEVITVSEAFLWRMGFSVLFFAAAWFLLPLDPQTRTIVAVSTLSPASIFATFFTDRMLGNAKLAGFQLTVTCIVSLILMTVVYLVL